MLLPLPKPQSCNISALFLKSRELFMSLEAGTITSEGSHETQQEFICKLMKAVQYSTGMSRLFLGSIYQARFLSVGVFLPGSIMDQLKYQLHMSLF